MRKREPRVNDVLIARCLLPQHITAGGEMKEHYEAVLQDIDKQERMLESQLAKIRAARPALLALLEDVESKENKVTPFFSAAVKYSTMGTKEAVLDVLSESSQPLTSGDIAQKLRDGGIRTQSTDFVSVINSTLASLKKMIPQKAERLDDGWIIAKSENQSVLSSVQ
jgi:dsDNA-specific endonuclease/ATPase MutS2